MPYLLGNYENMENCTHKCNLHVIYVSGFLIQFTEEHSNGRFSKISFRKGCSGESEMRENLVKILSILFKEGATSRGH